MIYVQCKLESDSMVDVRWIPQKLAVVGKLVKVKETGRLWTVTNTYGKANEDQVIEMRDRHKDHRKGTDI